MNKDMKLNAQAALGNIALTITTFAVTAFIIGPENPGYSTNLGPILGLLGAGIGTFAGYLFILIIYNYYFRIPMKRKVMFLQIIVF